MKQVDFYLISNHVPDAKYKLASRLSNKLLRLQQRALIVTEDSAGSRQLDKIMWSFSDTSFVAHDRLDQDDRAAGAPAPGSHIHIAAMEYFKDQPLTSEYDVLINVASAVPAINHNFVRIAEIVEPDEVAKAQARVRFKTYTAEGFNIKTHELEL